MYKSGKQWIFIGCISFMAITGTSVASHKVMADEAHVEQSNTQASDEEKNNTSTTTVSSDTTQTLSKIDKDSQSAAEQSTGNSINSKAVTEPQSSTDTQSDNQNASVTYIDQTTGITIKTDSLTGKSGQVSDYRTNDTITWLTGRGYELVSNDYPDNGVVFDRDDKTDQHFTVILKHKTTVVTPDNPGQPGYPVNPSNPGGPRYPNESALNWLYREVNQTVNYVDGQDKTVAPSIKDQVIFTRTGLIDQANGAITYTGWQAKNNDNELDEKQSPVISGYYTNQLNIPAQTVTPDTESEVKTVTYHKLGSLVPDVPGSASVPYPNDPKDPSKADNPIIPNIPGYTPVDSKGNLLKPGDTYPIDLSNPGQNTPMHYVKDLVTNKNDDGNGVDTGKNVSSPIDNRDSATHLQAKIVRKKSTTDTTQNITSKLPKTATQSVRNGNISILLTVVMGSVLGLLGLSISNKK